MTTRSSSRDGLRSTLANLKHLDLTGRVTYDKNARMTHGRYSEVFVGSRLLPDGRNTKVGVKRCCCFIDWEYHHHDMTKVRHSYVIV